MILDTNALSAIADYQPDATKLFRTAELVGIPVIVLGEFRFGILRSRRRLDYEEWLAQSLRWCRVLDVNDQTASIYAAIRVELRETGTPIPSNDLWIAALCRQHSLTLLSRDRHFDRVKNLKRLGW